MLKCTPAKTRMIKQKLCRTPPRVDPPADKDEFSLRSCAIKKCTANCNDVIDTTITKTNGRSEVESSSRKPSLRSPVGHLFSRPFMETSATLNPVGLFCQTNGSGSGGGSKELILSRRLFFKLCVRRTHSPKLTPSRSNEYASAPRIRDFEGQDRTHKAYSYGGVF